MSDRNAPAAVGEQLSLSPHDQQVFAAGYTEAINDHAGDIDTIRAQAAEIQRLIAQLRTAQADLERARRTAAALEQEAAGYFTQLQHAGIWDGELTARKSAYRTRKAEQQQRMIQTTHDGRPAYTGGPVNWR